MMIGTKLFYCRFIVMSMFNSSCCKLAPSKEKTSVDGVDCATTAVRVVRESCGRTSLESDIMSFKSAAYRAMQVQKKVLIFDKAFVSVLGTLP